MHAPGVAYVLQRVVRPARLLRHGGGAGLLLEGAQVEVPARDLLGELLRVVAPQGIEAEDGLDAGPFTGPGVQVGVAAGVEVGGDLVPFASWVQG